MLFPPSHATPACVSLLGRLAFWVQVLVAGSYTSTRCVARMTCAFASHSDQPPNAQTLPSMTTVGASYRRTGEFAPLLQTMSVLGWVFCLVNRSQLKFPT